MNKKDIAHIRRQFKLDHEALQIFDILNVYIMKESSEVYYYESQPFALLDRDQQELYMDNFRKLLTGELDRKLFDLKFQHEADDHTQQTLLQGLRADHSEDWNDQMLRIVGKMLMDRQYEQDRVVTFVRGEYFKSMKGRNKEAEQSEWDEVYKHPFIICSVNKTEQPQKALMFDYVEKRFNCNIAVDPIIKMTSPEAGFFFPTVTDHSANVNHVLYSAGKNNEPDAHFIEQVLHAERTVTAQEEKVIFEEIVKEVVGDQLEASTLAQVYEEINQMIEDNEDEDAPKLDYKDVERVLKVSGVEDVSTDKVEQAFQHVIDDKSYEFKASSIMPKYATKSIKINTKVAQIAISPQDLKYVKQVNYRGKHCILIEVDEEAMIGEFTIGTETL